MKIHNISEAPEAIGPYCHVTITGHLAFCSGQVALDPQTMKLEGTTIEEQTNRVFANITLVLSGIGLTLNNVVKTVVYLNNMDDFPGMNKVYGEIFKDHTPARSTVSVKKLPLDALVEIECIAELNEK